MDNFQLSTYAYPGLSDLATIRVSPDKADQAERWLSSLGGSVLQSKPTQHGSYKYNPATGARDFSQTPVQAITFQDNSASRDAIEFLRERPNAQETFYRNRIGSPEEGLSARGYDTLTQLKHQAAPADYLTKLGMRLPEHIKDPSDAEFERFAMTAATADDPEMHNAGKYAYSRLRDFSEKMGVPVRKLSTPQFAEVFNKTNSNPYSEERLKYVNGFASINGSNGAPSAIYIHSRPDVLPLKYAGTLAHEIGHALSMPDHTIAGTSGSQFLHERGPGKMAELHAEPIGYGIIRNLVPDIAKRGHYLRSLNFVGQSIPSNYPGNYGPSPSLLDYFNSPDFQNQVRSTVKYAGQLLA